MAQWLYFHYFVYHSPECPRIARYTCCESSLCLVQDLATRGQYRISSEPLRGMMRAISLGIRSYPTMGNERPYEYPCYMHAVGSVNKEHTAVY